MITFVEIEDRPNAALLDQIREIYQSIFTQIDLERFTKRIKSAEKLLTLLAFSNDELVGFKIGYQIDSTIFYSWLGGVKKEFREQGIADELIKRQHHWCQKQGFQIIQTKTRNSFKPMLILNIKNGFDIVEVYSDKSGETKIVLEKSLKN